MTSIIRASSGATSGIIQTADASGVLALNGDSTVLLQSNGVTIATVSSTGLTFTLPSTAAPAFSAVQGTVQTLSSGAVTKLSLQTKLFDTNSNFDNVTNYRFTPTVAGYYQVNASLQAAVSFTGGAIYLYKNGSNVFNGMAVNAGGGCFVLAYLVQMNGSTDYLEIYGRFDTGQAIATTTFQGSMARSM
jgi:hypothetical protein